MSVFEKTLEENHSLTTKEKNIGNDNVIMLATSVEEDKLVKIKRQMLVKFCLQLQGYMHFSIQYFSIILLSEEYKLLIFSPEHLLIENKILSECHK